jgi:branched-chain amino acid aminotransferase
MTTPAAFHVWINGELRPSDVPHLSVYDRGFQLGDGVFEALRARRGVGIELPGHLTRMRAGLESMAMALRFSDADLTVGVAALLAAEGWDTAEPPGDAVIRITVSRGFDPTRGIAPHSGGECSVVIQAWPFAPPSPDALRGGIRMITSAIRRDPGSPVAGIKTTSRADLVYARMEADRAGVDDALFLTPDGRVTEATAANILLIRGDACVTPRLGTGILAGTTRAWLVSHGDAVGLRMDECDVGLKDIFAADEAAVCSSVAGIVPVVAVDGRQIGNGLPGARSMAMREARERWIDEFSRATGATPPGIQATAKSSG